MEPNEQIILLIHRIEELERKVERHRREIERLRKRVAILEDAIPEWEPEESE